MEHNKKTMPVMVKSGFVFALLSPALLHISTAKADTEPPISYDARSVGMAGTGTADNDSAAAIVLNPANLDSVKLFTGTLTLTPAIIFLKGPFPSADGMSVVQENSGASLAPFGMIGAALRLHERVVVGLGMYMVGGIGGAYKKVDIAGGEDLSLALANGEMALPVSVRILDNLSFALGLRLGYSFSQADQIDPMSGTLTNQSLSGWGFPGFQVAVAYRPIKQLRLGAYYKSKINYDLSGTTTLANGAEFDTKSEWFSPHALRIGASLALLKDSLTLALDLRGQLYEESHKSIRSTTTVQGQEVEQTIQLDWINTLSGHLGAEYMLIPMLPIRAGFARGNSATPESTAGAFFPPPGLLYGFSIGAGLRFDYFDLDLGLNYSRANQSIDTPSVNGPPGQYGTDSLFMSLSGTARL